MIRQGKAAGSHGAERCRPGEDAVSAAKAWWLGPRSVGERPFLSFVGDYFRLTRPGIVAMVLVTMIVAAFVAVPGGWDGAPVAHALVGAGLVVAGAIALNQHWERESDAVMVRTALRPLPSGRLTPCQVMRFGCVVSLVGIVYLLVLTPPMVAALTAASWVVYVWLYTPMKSLSAWQTALGAIAGAMPTLIGAAAAGASPFDTMPLAWFGIVYFWQFPHAMAIAWLYRADFAAAEVKVVTVVDPSGRTAAGVALAGAAALLPISVIPYLDGRAGWEYAALALIFGFAYLGCAVAFRVRTLDTHARVLLRASLVYLPAISAALIVAVR